MSSIGEACRVVAKSLHEGGIEAADQEARDLVAHVVGLAPARLALESSSSLSSDQKNELDRLRCERLKGRTVARLIGRKRFHEIELLVNDDVLEPRSDTETLVELALPYLRNTVSRTGRVRFVDVGTGTGAIALALLHAEPRAIGIATDLSLAAVRLAARNAERLGLSDRFAVVQTNLLSGVSGPFDLLISNPPYIPTEQIAGLSREVRRDPLAALDGGANGLRVYRRLANEGHSMLSPSGICVVEIGAGQSSDVRRTFEAADWRVLDNAYDLSGHERALALAKQA